ncbi:MAG: mitochondrial import inner membrane translocase subunit tim54 [Phylliscum demangeonii]|nr:MAG: mitochondrial import inner membrane translocase subunit tim54 [Phylliscum demangeonii]
MADTSSEGIAFKTAGLGPQPAPAHAAAAAAAPAPANRNPALRMIGMSNVRWKLPSRNWLIFLSVTGTFASLVLYDRQQKKKVQKKWCSVVAHMAREPLDPRAMPRKVTIFLAAPPGDGVKASRDHFVEYVKPVLVAGALDWEVVEGRREGDVRARLAERIRRARRRAGEAAVTSTAPAGSHGREREEAEEEEEDTIHALRQKHEVQEWTGIKGDVVIGRHTWKEYIRGLHEGWLGPLEAPSKPSPLATSVGDALDARASPTQHQAEPFSDDTKPAVVSTTESESATESATTSPSTSASSASSSPASPPSVPKAFLSTSAYRAAPLPSSLPDALEPAAVIAQPHLLGFLDTPIRIYRFLNRRQLADQLGREAAAVVLGTTSERWQPQPAPSPRHTLLPSPGSPSSLSSKWPESEHGLGGPSALPADDYDPSSAPHHALDHSSHRLVELALASALADEEDDWPKSARDPAKVEEDEREREWADAMVLDDRIVSRMRAFQLSAEDEERARRIMEGGEVEVPLS